MNEWIWRRAFGKRKDSNACSDRDNIALGSVELPLLGVAVVRHRSYSSTLFTSWCLMVCVYLSGDRLVFILSYVKSERLS